MRNLCLLLAAKITMVERTPVCALSMLAALLAVLEAEAAVEEALDEAAAALESIWCQFWSKFEVQGIMYPWLLV
jgi:hypothetical protein